MLDRLASALRKADVPGITVVQAKGFGREHRQADLEMVGFLSERIKVEIIVDDSQADEIVDLVQNTVRTGNVGDGIVYVANLDTVRRISDKS